MRFAMVTLAVLFYAVGSLSYDSESQVVEQGFDAAAAAVFEGDNNELGESVSSDTSCIPLSSKLGAKRIVGTMDGKSKIPSKMEWNGFPSDQAKQLFNTKLQQLQRQVPEFGQKFAPLLDTDRTTWRGTAGTSKLCTSKCHHLPPPSGSSLGHVRDWIPITRASNGKKRTCKETCEALNAFDDDKTHPEKARREKRYMKCSGSRKLPSPAELESKHYTDSKHVSHSCEGDKAYSDKDYDECLCYNDTPTFREYPVRSWCYVGERFNLWGEVRTTIRTTVGDDNDNANADICFAVWWVPSANLLLRKRPRRVTQISHLCKSLTSLTPFPDYLLSAVTRYAVQLQGQVHTSPRGDLH